MLEQFFNRHETPFGLVRFHLDDLKGCFVVDRMSRKIAKFRIASTVWRNLCGSAFFGSGSFNRRSKMRFSCTEPDKPGFVHHVYECIKCQSTQSFVTPV